MAFIRCVHQRHGEGIQVIDWTGEHGLQIGRTVVQDEHLLRATWLLVLLTTITSMAIHFLSGDMRAIPFFISESDFPGPQRVVFKAGFTSAGVLMCALAMRIPHTFDIAHEQKYGQLAKWFGITAGVTLVGLAWFNMHDQIIIHSIFAMASFMGGYGWSCTVHYTLSNAPSLGHARRKVWMVVGAVSFAVMNLSLTGAVRTHVIEGGLRDGVEIMNLSQNSIVFAAIAEYFLYLSLVMMLASFEHDLALAKQQE